MPLKIYVPFLNIGSVPCAKFSITTIFYSTIPEGIVLLAKPQSH